MIEVETQTIEVEVVTNTEVTSTGQVEVETVDLSDLDITVAKKEYVITGDDIYIPMLYDDAPQWMKNLVQVVVDVSISSGNQSLINDMNAIIQDFAVSYVPLNQYTQSIIDLSDEDTRLNGLIEALNSNFNDGLSTANAQIISLQLTKASKDEVVAQVIQTIAAQLADGASNIGSIIGRIDQAIANETSARALSLQTLTASLEDTNLDVTANAEVIQNALAYVGIDEAGASTGTGLSAYLEDSNGNIGGADSELANSIRVTAEGVESKFAYNSLLNINGVYKKSGFGLTTNYTSGNGTQANPYVSEFWIDASRLKFTNSNVTGSVAPFTIDATGVTPQITFNGKVTFGNITNVPQLGSTPQEVVTAINNAQTTTINGPRITTGSIGAAQIAANSISADRISSYNLTSTNATIQNGMISNAMITDASITNAKIADASITNAKITDASITNAKIANLSVDTFKIQDEAIVVPRFAIGSGSCTIVYAPSISHNVSISVYGDSLHGATYTRRKFFLNGNLQSNKYQSYTSEGSGFYYDQFSFYLWAGNTYTFRFENVSMTVQGDGAETVINLEAKMTMLGVKK